MAIVDIDAALSANASMTSDIVAVYAAVSSVAGSAAVSSDLVATYAGAATLSGSATQTASAGFLFSVSSSLSSSSSVTSSAFLYRLAQAVLLGQATVSASITWTPHPGSPTPLPAGNSAQTLQQFIAALGVSKSVSRTPAANNVAVNPNPPRKPFVPR